MEFPEVWDRNRWRIIKNSEDFWIELKDKDRKLIGLKTVYEKIGSGGSEKMLELNFFKKGAVIQIWLRGLDNKKVDVQSRIMRQGNWIYGMSGRAVTLEALVDGNLKLRGVRAQLQVRPEEIVIVDFYKSGLEPMPGNFPD